VTEAYHTVRLLTELGEEIALLERGVEALGRGLIDVGPGGRIRAATRIARAWLVRYFPGRSGSAELPEPLGRWLRHGMAPVDGVPPSGATLVVGGGAARLFVRAIAQPTGWVLVLEERAARDDHASLRRLGLSPRESDVLVLVADGLTNPAIAARLACSPRTVQTRLERIYRKLGVSARAAAAA
jgi:DNA-binding CsgD family transcriptional regulator